LGALTGFLVLLTPLVVALHHPHPHELLDFTAPVTSTDGGVPPIGNLLVTMLSFPSKSLCMNGTKPSVVIQYTGVCMPASCPTCPRVRMGCTANFPVPMGIAYGPNDFTCSNPIGAFPVNFQPVGSLPCDKTWFTVACQAPFQSSYVALVKAYVDTTNGCLESATLNEYVTEDAAASNFCTAAPNTPGLFVKVSCDLTKKQGGSSKFNTSDCSGSPQSIDMLPLGCSISPRDDKSSEFLQCLKNF